MCACMYDALDTNVRRMRRVRERLQTPRQVTGETQGAQADPFTMNHAPLQTALSQSLIVAVPRGYGALCREHYLWVLFTSRQLLFLTHWQYSDH